MHGAHDPLPQVETQPSGDTEEGKGSQGRGDREAKPGWMTGFPGGGGGEGRELGRNLRGEETAGLAA